MFLRRSLVSGPSICLCTFLADGLFVCSEIQKKKKKEEELRLHIRNRKRRGQKKEELRLHIIASLLASGVKPQRAARDHPDPSRGSSIERKRRAYPSSSLRVRTASDSRLDSRVRRRWSAFRRRSRWIRSPDPLAAKSADEHICFADAHGERSTCHLFF